MAKIALGTAWKPEKTRKKTAQGNTNSSLKLSSMGKDKKRSHKKYRGQGR